MKSCWWTKIFFGEDSNINDQTLHVMIITKQKPKLKQTKATREWESRASLKHTASISPPLHHPLAFGGNRPMEDKSSKENQKIYKRRTKKKRNPKFSSSWVNKKKNLKWNSKSDGAAIEEKEETEHGDQSHWFERCYHFPHHVVHNYGQETHLRSTPAQPAPHSVTRLRSRWSRADRPPTGRWRHRSISSLILEVKWVLSL